MISFDINTMSLEAQLALITVFGLALGSFLNVVISRLPGGRREFFSSIFSRCPHCRGRIRWYDNIPLLSYLLLRGRCRDCGVTIPLQYPLVEAAMAAVAVFLYLQYSATAYFYLYICFFAILIAVSVIDLRQRWIPDSLVIIGIGCGIIGSLFTPLPGWTHAMAGLVFGTTIPLMLVTTYETLRGKIVMGGGDIKLIGMIGAFLGWQPLGLILFYSALVGSLAALGLKWAGRFPKLPFAPMLTLGTLLAVFAPDLIPFLKVRL
ncbi:prepilin peptidase [Desulfobulbus alkaliphilus]|uniref:prepilin peptidase n=1 Tax=Desulfobulbus alkaliphilus TaxID=869814 RepID=UPI001966445B|nr:A24 family peptidase [Desulfobulbus alkaliphilus]MBM9536583.1 prepilin peptidase [Desulfobulbus alkaliphilus]